jgi:EAL domain-containing protein (putative c-di-GMP-specific phosphodiesterase class I)
LVEACEIEGIPTHLLEVEVTESALLENIAQATALLSRFRNNGFTVSLDDFGTGYSSLSYLRDLPFDKVKIDRSFVISLDEGPRSAALTRGIVNLCRALGMKTVAEGVETRAQFDTLQSMGVNEFQGYLFAKPLEFEAALKFGKDHH